MRNRQLKWDGCINVRDLGGLPACDGRKTRWGALVRSDAPSKLTTKGWDALWAYGIRTIISLRTEGKTEHDFDLPNLPSGIDVVSVAIEDLGDPEFVQQWAATGLWCAPLYYHDALLRWPQRHAYVITTFAQAQTGGVLIHCSRGHDRTGIISMLMLAMVGVSTADIVSDYELSPDPECNEILRARNTSSRNVILDKIAIIEGRKDVGKAYFINLSKILTVEGRSENSSDKVNTSSKQNMNQSYILDKSKYIFDNSKKLRLM